MTLEFSVDMLYKTDWVEWLNENVGYTSGWHWYSRSTSNIFKPRYYLEIYSDIDALAFKLRFAV